MGDCRFFFLRIASVKPRKLYSLLTECKGFTAVEKPIRIPEKSLDFRRIKC